MFPQKRYEMSKITLFKAATCSSFSWSKVKTFKIHKSSYWANLQHCYGYLQLCYPIVKYHRLYAVRKMCMLTISTIVRYFYISSKTLRKLNIHHAQLKVNNAKNQSLNNAKKTFLRFTPYHINLHNIDKTR